MLPSGIGGPVTQEVGYFQADVHTVATWLRDGLGSSWEIRAVSWGSLPEAAAELTPSVPLSREAVVPIGSWALILNNGPLGTDVGLLPSQAARDLGCRALRAVCSDDDPGYPARVLEVYGPGGDPPLLGIRTIAAVNDGGSWVFETSGEPFPFERPDEYARPRVTDRFPSELLYEYLRRLGAPVDVEPAWSRTLLVERVGRLRAASRRLLGSRGLWGDVASGGSSVRGFFHF